MKYKDVNWNQSHWPLNLILFFQLVQKLKEEWSYLASELHRISDSWVIDAVLDWLDPLIFMVPFLILPSKFLWFFFLRSKINQLNVHYSNPLPDNKVFYSRGKDFD